MRRLVSVVLTTALAASLAACASVYAAENQPLSADPAVDTCRSAAHPLDELEPVVSPRTLTGPVTACLPDPTISPVADNTPPNLPITLTDAEGRTVTVTDVSRILPIDISGTIAATVFALGLGENVVGRDTSTEFPGTENLPVVTKSGHTLNAEAILQLAPTIVLTDTTIGTKEVRQQLRDAGITVVVITSDRRLDTATGLVDEIATALGVPTRGDALGERITNELGAVAREVSAVAPVENERPRMLFLYVRGNANVYYIFGRDSGADSLIDAVGGIDVASDIGWEGMKPMTAEALVAAQPDVIVMMTAGLESMGGVDGLLDKLPAIAQTPAGAHRRVIDMDDSAILSFGPRSADIVRALAAAVYSPGTGE